MQLKHRGKQVRITLTKPETGVLEKAALLLEAIGLLPCPVNQQAAETAKAVSEIVAKLEEDEAE